MVRVIISRKLRWAGHVARMEEGRSAFNILTGKHIGKRPLERPRPRKALFFTRSLNLWKITFISSLCSIGKLSFSSFSIFSFLLIAPNIFFCFSNHRGPVIFFFLLFSFPSSVLQWQHERDNLYCIVLYLMHFYKTSR